jgi:membrane-associated PAP2 superfamily phosphatase
MLENLVRKILGMVGINDATDEQLIFFIRKWKLEKLPPHYIFMTRSIFPVIEMVMKKLSEETIDWSEINFEENEKD